MEQDSDDAKTISFERAHSTGSGKAGLIAALNASLDVVAAILYAGVLRPSFGVATSTIHPINNSIAHHLAQSLKVGQDIFPAYSRIVTELSNPPDKVLDAAIAQIAVFIENVPVMISNFDKPNQDDAARLRHLYAASLAFYGDGTNNNCGLTGALITARRKLHATGLPTSEPLPAWVDSFEATMKRMAERQRRRGVAIENKLSSVEEEMPRSPKTYTSVDKEFEQAVEAIDKIKSLTELGAKFELACKLGDSLDQEPGLLNDREVEVRRDDVRTKAEQVQQEQREADEKQKISAP